MSELYVFKCRTCGKKCTSLKESSAQRQAEDHMMEKGHIMVKLTNAEIFEDVRKMDDFLNRHTEKVK